jgi:hypothetical protein
MERQTVEALADAGKRGWVIVDMKNDWNRVIEITP